MLINVFVETTTNLFVCFHTQCLVELSNYQLIFFNVQLKFTELLLKLPDFRDHSHVKIFEIFILGESLKLSPNALRIFYCNEFANLCIDFVYLAQ